jgi:uncharacterized protein with HEPN domain
VSRDWRGYIEDMQEACEHAIAFVEGLDLGGFTRDAKTRSAVQREIFVLGEAAKQVPAAVQDRHPEVDWRGIAGLRDILAHHYFRIDDAIIWDVVAHELPKLQLQLRKIVATES